jgi:putative membrane protein
MLYLWVKTIHVVFVVAWFAGLFYLPRLFVYHADTRDSATQETFKVMERRLYGFTTLNAVVAIACGIGLLVLAPAFVHQSWLHAKVLLVALLVGFQHVCNAHLRRFRQGTQRHGSLWYRWFNEVPTVLLLAIVALVILKPGA